MTGAGTVGRVEALRRCHAETMGDASVRVFQAPGRVNLLGEHTDYSGGFCMPAALNFNTLVAATPRTDGLLRLHSMDFKETVKIQSSELDAWRTGKGDGHWSAYLAGVAWSLRERGVKVTGADLTMQGDVPPGAGLSSSASVEVATATALLALAGVTLPTAEVALACQRAENVYVGAPCGIMDQFISASGGCGQRAGDRHAGAYGGTGADSGCVAAGGLQFDGATFSCRWRVRASATRGGRGCRGNRAYASGRAAVARCDVD